LLAKDSRSPFLQADERNIGIASAVVDENRAGYFPTLSAGVTAAGSQASGHRSADSPAVFSPKITAGGLNDPTVLNRAAAGITVTQLVTDFGPTGNLIDSAKASLEAARNAHESVRQALLLKVTEAFARGVEAQGTLSVAQKTYDERKLLLDQITLLQQNNLKSELDVEFASVNLDQANLLVLQSQSLVQSSVEDMISLTGMPAAARFEFVDDTTAPVAPPVTVEILVQDALDHQPALESLRQKLDAARKYAKAQRALAYPTLSLVGAAGVTPIGDDTLSRNYSAGAVNLSIPLFQGGRINAQSDEARLRAEQLADDLRDAQMAVTRDVKTAWFNALNDFQSLSVYEKLNASAKHALDLAESRYRLGISSIVELNGAQLNALDSEISLVRAHSHYQVSTAQLAYQVGKL
jgi:outer membrane protein